MKLNKKIHLIIAGFFGLYTILTSLSFDPYFFLITPIDILGVLLLLFSTSLMVFFYFRIARNIAQHRLKTLVLVLSFPFTITISSSLIWIIYQGTPEKYLLYLSSFVISSIIPSVVLALWLFFQHIEDKILLVNKRNELNNEEESLFQLTNANGKILLEVPLKQILCFEANDNYVVTYYLSKDDKIQKSMERASLKNITEILEGQLLPFARVHKSYIINPTFISEIKGKAQSYKIILNGLALEIPVSRSFKMDSIKK